MKKTTKLAALAVGLAALVGFTSCDPDTLASIGKDDLFGTWMTMDYVDGVLVPYYEAKITDNKNDGTAGNKYAITWEFDGKSENIGAKRGVFSQRLINYGDSPVVETKTGNEGEKNEYKFNQITSDPINDTFWFGEYDVTANSSYSRGKLYLYYEAGINVKNIMEAGYRADADKKNLVEGTEKKYDKTAAEDVVTVLKTWTLADYANWAFDNDIGLENLKSDDLKKLAYNEVKNGSSTPVKDTTWNNGAYKANYVTLQVRYNEKNKIVCSDVEYFRFNLKDVSASGYTRMMATLYNQKGESADNIIGGIYNQWATADEATTDNLGKSTNFGYKVKDSCSWSGTNIRYMGRVSVESTPENLKWLPTTSNKTNADLFSVTDADDTDSDYADVEGTTITEEKDPAQ